MQLYIEIFREFYQVVVEIAAPRNAVLTSKIG